MTELAALLGPLSLLAFVLAGFTMILGFKAWSGKLLLIGFALALTTPLLSVIFWKLSLAAPALWQLYGGKIVGFGFMVLTMLFLGAWLRYRRHRSLIETVFTNKPTSTKRRLDQ